MSENDRYLFVYGTLLDENNPHGLYLKENSVFLREGRLCGELYNIGNYPGATLRTATDSWVYGSIFLLNDPKTTLKELDDYEGFGDDFVQPNEFIRELVEVDADGTNLKCWVYLYNLPVNAVSQISSGDYLKSECGKR